MAGLGRWIRKCLYIKEKTLEREEHEIEMTLFPCETTTTLSSRAKRGICILLFATASNLISAQSILPPGWRRPSPVEVSAAWRRKSPTKFLIVKVDFDGDGHTDVAEILTNESEKRCALFVRLSRGSGEWITLWKGPTVALRNVGIRMVRPGKYDTLCGDDPSACNPETPKSVDFEHNALSLFFEGETSSIFYWDRKTKKFDSVPISD
jgi:hypothetical protein